MNARHIFFAPPCWWMALALALALALRPAPSQAEPIRVTTWDLQPAAAAGAQGWSDAFQQSLVQEAAGRMKKLRPDVILLQQAADWQTCRQLAQALQPETYRVVICSSFRDRQGRLLRRQVAILSKTKAYLAWSEPWQNSGVSPAAPGGFAFAALRLDHKNVGVFSVQFSDGVASGADDGRRAEWEQARGESTRQLVRQIAALQGWQNNRLQTLIVAGNFNTTPEDSRGVHEKTLSLLEQFGFDNALAGTARPPAAPPDYILTRDAGRVGPALFTPSPFCARDAVTREMDLSAPKAMPAPAPKAAPAHALPAAPKAAAVAPSLATRADLPPVKPVVNAANRAPAPVAPARPTPPAAAPRSGLWFAGFLAAGLALLVLARKLVWRSEPAPLPATAPELQARPGVGVALPYVEQIFFPPPPASPPYVHVEMEGSMQTQSQTGRPRVETQPVTAPMTEGTRSGVIANLSRWLKQKVVQRLVLDRAQLLATQEAAGLKLLAVDQRLAGIERQIQRINQEYERRIDDLLTELVAAREENRELIRDKIALVKAEMEKARLKSAPRAREHQQY